jgi:hypothetical protein
MEGYSDGTAVGLLDGDIVGFMEGEVVGTNVTGGNTPGVGQLLSTTIKIKPILCFSVYNLRLFNSLNNTNHFLSNTFNNNW